MPIKALVFDMDDTLYPEREYVESGLRAVDEWLRRTRGIAGFRDAAAEAFAAGERRRVFDAALERLGAKAEPSLVAAMVEAYRAHRPDIRLSEDAEAVLRRLAPSVRTGLISDGYLPAQERKVEALGLAGRLHCVLLTETLGRDCWKPSPVPYERMSEALGVAPEECAYVGDNAAKDFVAAKRLGWTTLQLLRQGGLHAGDPPDAAHAADYRIVDLRTLWLLPDFEHLFTSGTPYPSNEEVAS